MFSKPAPSLGNFFHDRGVIQSLVSFREVKSSFFSCWRDFSHRSQTPRHCLRTQYRIEVVQLSASAGELFLVDFVELKQKQRHASPVLLGIFREGDLPN